MSYLTTIEEHDGVLRISVHESKDVGARTVALLACVHTPATAIVLRELLRVAVESLALPAA
jgi:hypothetical protein